MTSTIDALPWFVRNCIFDYCLLSRNRRSIIRCINGTHIIQADPPASTYHSLRQVSKSFAAECKTALLRTCPILLQDKNDLEAVPEALSSTEAAVVHAVVVKVQHKYMHDAIELNDRAYDCFDLKYHAIKGLFPNLKTLEIDQDPGSVKLQSQSEFETVAEDITMRGATRYFANGWGMTASNTTLVGTAYDMGDSMVKWFRELIMQAREDHISVDITVRFHCAADPRLQREDLQGTMGMDDRILIVEHQGATWRLPQVFDDVPTTLNLTNTILPTHSQW